MLPELEQMERVGLFTAVETRWSIKHTIIWDSVLQTIPTTEYCRWDWDDGLFDKENNCLMTHNALFRIIITTS
jgi:hypothetical protein